MGKCGILLKESNGKGRQRQGMERNAMMGNDIIPERDVWEKLRDTDKPIVFYGMGNGADKILSVMERYGAAPADFFASDEFVRGHSFHGKTVLRLSEIREKYRDPLIVIAFASSLPEVTSRMDALDREYEVVVPDVPVAGDTVFTREFYIRHEAEFRQAYSLLADTESRSVYENIIKYKLSGSLSALHAAESKPDEVMKTIVKPESIRVYADFGAYSGDTVRAMLSVCPNLHTVYAMEPDEKTFRKLSAYAENETRAGLLLYPSAAWSRSTTLTFRVEGNRNSTAAAGGLTGGIRQAKEKEVRAERPDAIFSGEVPPFGVYGMTAEGNCAIPDYIKYDVEGAEREALLGTRETIVSHAPRLLVSAYHRPEDIFALPILLNEMQPRYRFYLRRFPGVPAWDINLYCTAEE